MVSNVCSRSQGQPPGARRRAMMETALSNFSPVDTGLMYHQERETIHEEHLHREADARQNRQPRRRFATQARRHGEDKASRRFTQMNADRGLSSQVWVTRLRFLSKSALVLFLLRVSV